MKNLQELIDTFRHRRFVVLTGAGISTESGIPDYRGPQTRHIERKPITFQEFSADRETRRRYWARARHGWPKIRDAQPNLAHQKLVELEAAGVVSGIITQNVDRLHHRAGSENVIELHGALAEVMCVSCKSIVCRDDLQIEIDALNPDRQRVVSFAPDGDSELGAADVAKFIMPVCVRCDGDYKPRVVFFGENVDPVDRDLAFDWVDDAEALLVIGSSLQVYSGLRYVKHAAQQSKPIGIINLGETRGDPYAWAQVEMKASVALSQLTDALLDAQNN